ncbi:MAG: hypothetical protein HXL04_02335 [Candidatus Nanosynbacter sp.]|nr:hypothetical protein [Candidatus Nanosynbacter sp.]
MANRNSEFGDIMPISGNLSHEGRMAALRAFGDGAKLMSDPDGSLYLQLTGEQPGAPWQGGYMPSFVEAGAQSDEDGNSQAASPDTLSEEAAVRRAFLQSRPGRFGGYLAGLANNFDPSSFEL